MLNLLSRDRLRWDTFNATLGQIQTTVDDAGCFTATIAQQEIRKISSIDPQQMRADFSAQAMYARGSSKGHDCLHESAPW
jgi:hypothetical protein